MNSEKRNRWLVYSVAVLAPFLGLWAHNLAIPLLGRRAPFAFFFIATLGSAAFGGWRPGLTSTIVGAILAALYVLPPIGNVSFQYPQDYIALVAYLIVSTVISLICGRLMQARQNEHALREIFEQTLLGIGDAIISTDADGRIRLMNRRAEDLTGWTRDDAQLRSIEEVFRIVEEGTDNSIRIPIREPIQQVLGPANRTELVTKDKRRVPIEDCLSPVLNAEGEMLGSVLVFRDISTRKREEAELHRLNEDLKQFNYAATHDLREPLRMITVYSELLEERLSATPDPDVLRYLSYVVTGAKRIGRLVDGLLVFSRMGDLKPADFSPVANCDTALRDALEDLRLHVEESGAVIRAAPMPDVAADSSHVTQIFQNLIRNALKYRNPGLAPEISVSADSNGEWCTLTVADNGAGIAPGYEKAIFEPMKRLHGPEIPGAGLGLAICSRIVAHYGGRIWAESAGQGSGATFRFTLPSAKAARPVLR